MMTDQARILIVEDDTLIATELQERLHNLGYRVCAHTRTTEDALILAEGLQPNLVLMDIRLRGRTDDVESAGLIRSHFDIPVVYVAAGAGDANLARAKGTRPYGYVIRPFREGELLSSIEVALYRHEVEKELRDRERRLSATLGCLGDAVATTDAQGRILLANPAAEALLGALTREGKPVLASQVLTLYAAGSPGGETAFHPVREVLRDGQARDLSGYELRTVGGERVAVQGSATPVTGMQGDTVGVVVILRDVTQQLEEERHREALRERLYEAQQVEVVASLTSRLAHDFNEHLTSILAAASLILAREACDEADPVRTAAERISQAARRAAGLTRQILSLTGEEARHLRAVDVHALLTSAAGRLNTLAGARITLKHHLWPVPLHVRADPVELEQVLVHLALNAHEAMPDGGVVEISTGVCEARAASYVYVRFSDTGTGMDADTRARAFEPFFSTKPGSAGLGLSISKNIVEQLGGWIEVETAPGSGSVLTVHFPLCAPGDDAPSAPSLEELHGCGQRVLLVEDDAEVRLALCEMLQAGGYSVLEAAHAHQALDLFEAAPTGVDLLLADITLPDRDGLALADACRSFRPQLPVLIIGSVTSHDAHWLNIRSHGYAFLPKPFGLMDLLPAVHDALRR